MVEYGSERREGDDEEVEEVYEEGVEEEGDWLDRGLGLKGGELWL